jgi:GMP synthase-like glutamine amidotransferase
MLHIIQNDPKVPAGVFGEILAEKDVPYRTVLPYAGEALPAGAAAIIVLGGYMGVHDEALYPFLRPLKGFMCEAVAAGTPLLGVCLGGQLLAEAAGGTVKSNHRSEKGLVPVTLTPAGSVDPLFAGVPRNFAAFAWHNDSFDPPPCALHLALSRACPGQAFRLGNAWGVQFHPEVDRDIVAAWSAPVDPQGDHLAEFAAAEAEHRALARRLLENFLAIAGILPPHPA